MDKSNEILIEKITYWTVSKKASRIKNDKVIHEDDI